MSQTNMLIRSELQEDIITKPIREINHSFDWQTKRAANGGCIRRSAVHNAVSLQSECYSEIVDALVTVLQCLPLLRNPQSATAQKLPLKSYCGKCLAPWARVCEAGVTWYGPRNILTVLGKTVHSQRHMYVQFECALLCTALRNENVDLFFFCGSGKGPLNAYAYITYAQCIQGVPVGMCQTSGECSLR